MMKKISLTLLAILPIFSLIALTNVPAGNVNGIFQSSGSPYLINGDVVIPNGQTLTIQPGVEIRFTGAFRLKVEGRLLSIGTAGDSIRFTTSDAATKWRGIWFDNVSAGNDSSRIDYCVLEKGDAHLNSLSTERNGGLLRVISFSRLRVEHSRFNNASAASGGAIYCKGASFSIRNCLFKNNSSDSWGGVIHADDPSPVNSSITISACEFHDNAAGGVGGAVSFYAGTNNQITNSVFYRNHAYQGGAIAYWWSAGCVSNCSIYYNYSYERGGGIFGRESTLAITGNNIYNQYYTTDWYNPVGGGIGCAGGNYIIEGNRIANNSTYYDGAGIGLSSCAFKIYNNLVTGNSCSFGGGGITANGCWGTENVLANNTVYGNSSSNAGGLYINGNARIKNNIIWGNSPATSQIKTYTDGVNQIWTYNNIQNGLGAFLLANPGSWYPDSQYLNNLNANPLFVSTSDWRLQSSSPCINAGDPGTMITDFPWDYADNERISQGIIDIGAYEYMSPFIPKAPRNVVLQQTQTGCMLSWQAVTQALDNSNLSPAGYHVYFADNPQGNFQLLGTTGGTSIPVQTAEVGQRFYIVKAYTNQ
jgi:hypothetical protein